MIQRIKSMEETFYAIIKEYWIVVVLVIDFIVLFVAWAIGSTLRELDDN